MLRRIWIVMCLPALASCTAVALSVASAMTNGATIVDADYRVEKYVATYRVESDGAIVTPNLVMDKGKLALLEISPRWQKGFLVTTHWQTEHHDHFAAWITDDMAMEMALPKDRTLAGERFKYEKDSYRLQTIDGIERPVPLGNRKVEYRLLPVKQY